MPGGDAWRAASTDPGEAARFANETGIDAMAISIGNVHLEQVGAAPLDEQRLAAIEAATALPLVIHGGSGVPPEQRAALARKTSICKFNIGTKLRIAFGATLRQIVNADPTRFDRIAILRETHEPVMSAARAVIRTLCAPDRRERNA